MSLYPNLGSITEQYGDPVFEGGDDIGKQEVLGIPEPPAINVRLPSDMRRAQACLIIDNFPAGSMYGDGSGITLKFQFLHQPGFYSYIRLAFTVCYLAKTDDTELTRGEFSYYLYSHSVVEPMILRHIVKAAEANPSTEDELHYLSTEFDHASTVVELANSEVDADGAGPNDDTNLPAPSWLRQLDEQADDRLAAGLYWLMEIPRGSSWQHDEALFTSRTFGDQQDLVDRIRAHLANLDQPLTLLLREHHVNATVQLISNVWQNEPRNPLSPFYPTHPETVFIKVDDYPDVDHRPNPYVERLVSMPNRDVYVTVLGYGLVGEEEHTVKQDMLIPELTANLRAVEIPHGGNRGYIAFISFPRNEQVALKPDDEVLLDFNPDVNNATAQ